MRNNYKFIIVFILLGFLGLGARAQSTCDSVVPSFSVDLTSSPTATWTSPSVVRAGTCCGTSNNCIEFILYLHPNAVSINFTIPVGAVASGSMFYQLNCSPEVPVGEPICIDGPGPHIITFCKPGDNQNTYAIESISAPIIGPDITVASGCIDYLHAQYYDESTVTWTSLAPGASGDYDTLLSCNAGCDTTYLTSSNVNNPNVIDYYVCGYDAAGCIDSAICDTITATLLDLHDVSISAADTILCSYEPSTTLTVNSSGGTGNFTYLWSTGDTTTSITVGPGIYYVDVLDTSGCSTNSDTLEIIQLPEVVVTAGPDVDICNQFQANIPLTSSVLNATGVSWSGGNGSFPLGNTILNAAYLPTPGELLLNEIELYVASTGNQGCNADVDTLTINLFPFQDAVSISTTDVNCYNGTDGTSTTSVTGTQSPWNFNLNNSLSNSTGLFTNLGAGNYLISVVDNLGCTLDTSFIIEQPDTLIMLVSNQTNVNCFGNTTGTATATVTGGTAPYTYSWNTSPVQTSSTALGLAAGTYTCTVTDANNCTETIDVTITQPAAPLAVSIASISNVNCFGDATGSATVNAQGGTAPYSYSWNTTPAQTTATASGLTAGSYTCIVTDANGCIAVISTTITQPSAPLNASISNTVPVDCFGALTGSATATAQGGTPNYSYTWNTSPTQNTATATGLPAGTYTCTITDENGCTDTTMVTITQPAAALTASIASSTNVNCFGDATGSATASAQNGTPGYSYSWSTSPVQTTATASGLTAGTYTCTVTDANGCTAMVNAVISQPTAPLALNLSSLVDVNCFGEATGSATVVASNGTPGYTYSWNTIPVQTTAMATNLTAGTYTCTVTDNNGCTETIDATILQPSAALAVNINAQTNVNCFGDASGSATAVASFGTPGYSYSWNTSPIQTSATASGLVAGTYTCTVTDAFGCTESASVTITQPAAPLDASVASYIPVGCFGDATGSATTTVQGGTPGYSYSWNTSPVQNSITATSLAAGSYVCTVTDNLGCIDTAKVTITQPMAALSLNLSSTTNVNCFGDATGSATVVAQNGTPGYSYAWNTTPVQTSATATGLVAGTYTCTVTDANGCTEDINVNITQPAAPLSLTVNSTTNVSCYGNATGSATIAVTGGTPGYAYAWNTVPVQNSATANGLAAGTYTCTVTDVRGCSATISVTITQPTAALAASITSTTPVDCFGAATGSATASAQYGTPGYAYTWNTSPVQNTATADNLLAGNYICTVTDILGCIDTVHVTITQPAAPLALSIASSTDIACYGDANGSITVAAANGTPGYTYSWNTTPVQTSATAVNLTAGTYSCTVTDANGCVSSINATLSQPTAPLQVNLNTVNDVNCYGDATGSIAVIASNGTPGYNYSWNTSPVQTSATATGLTAGTYTCTVTDANGCTTSISATVTQPSGALTANISSISNVNCFGDATGSATVTASFGTPGYTYSWNTTPVQTNATATGLAAGSYTCTVTDALGCTTTTSVTITQPLAPISLSLVSTTAVGCYGDATGSATIASTGGTPTYSYAWNTTPVQTSATATGLAAGTYTCTVTDNLGCTATITVTITQPAAPLGVSIASISDVNCFGDATGSATVNAFDGTPGYTYSWNTTPVQTSATATGLAAGTYTCTVTDANGCTASVSATVTQPAAPIALSISANTPVSCYGFANGSATVASSGGTPGYTYAWNTTPVQTSATASGLAAGTYTCTVTDILGCSETISVTITQPAAALSLTVNPQINVACYGDATGAANVVASNGTPGYTYAWNTTPIQTTANATGLTAGTYTCTVTDANGCVETISVTITQPAAPLTLSVFATSNVDCYGDATGAATIQASNGTPGYTYSWNTTPVQTSATASGLAAGTYTCTVTDANGCVEDINVNITQPAAPISLSIGAISNVDCYGDATGSASVIANDGTPGYTYSWNTTPVQTSATATNLAAGTYTCTVTDALGCVETITATVTQPAGALTASVASISNVNCFGDATGSATVTASFGTPGYTYSWNTTPVQTNATATGLAAGTYTCTVTDALGCTTTTTANVTQPSAPLSLSIASTTNVGCYGDATGAATISASGGTPAYTYSWNTTPVQTGATATGLAAGNYICTVTDNLGCTATITVTIAQPAAPLGVSIASISDVNCFGDATGSATVSAFDGTPGYTYSWNTTPVQTSATATGLAAGTYTCTVTDANGCTASVSATVTQPAAPIALSISANTPVSCYGFANGSATVASTGGTPGYTYAWNTTPVQTTATASGLAAGTYTCTVTDILGCSETISVTITQPAAALSLTVNPQINVACYGDATGAANVVASNGTPGYTYAWNTTPIQTTANATGLAAGTYTCTVTDANGCVETISVTITQPAAPLTLSVFATSNVDCYGDATGAATIQASNGTPGYTYSWNTTPVQTSATASGLAAGTYTCTVTDANGCVEDINVNITQPAAPLAVSISSVTPVNCYGDATGSASVQASNGTPGYTYSWNTSPAQYTATATGLPAGIYTCTVTDALGCSEAIMVSITQPTAPLNITLASKTNVDCYGNMTGAASVNVTGGTAGYSYSWNTTPVQTTATATGLAAGSYTCTVTDAVGCTATFSVTINEPSAPLALNIIASSDILCYGDASGAATVQASFGTPGYTYSWNTTPIQTTSTASGLTAGTYTCTVTDANGCTEFINVNLSQPAAPLAVSISGITHIDCYGDATGSASVTAFDGTPGYTYSWNTSPVQTTATATGLTAGTYTCTVIDANGCSETVDVTITQPAAPLNVIIAGKTNVLCYGDATGTATLLVQGGTPNYTYAWNTSPVQTTATATGLTAGTYTCTITDANGCTTTRTVIIQQPNAPMNFQIDTTVAVLCYDGNNGSISVTGNGGVPPYSYHWSHNPNLNTGYATNLTAGNYECIVEDNNGCTVTLQTIVQQPNAPLTASIDTVSDVNCYGGFDGWATVQATGGTAGYTYVWNTIPQQYGNTAVNLAEGIYTCTVTDANGCSTGIEVTVNQPNSALNVSISNIVNVYCFNDTTGSATVSVEGGTPNYTYAWNTSPVQTTATAVNLAIGTYTCVVTDANGCTDSIMVTISQPINALNANILVKTDVSCYGGNNGSATVMGTGGTPGYTYEWNTTPVQYSNTATGLTAGTYSCTVTDASGCTFLKEVTITEPSQALNVATLNIVDVSCFNGSDGSIMLNATGGTPGYSYFWNTNPVQNSNIAVNLSAGTYTCTVTDNNGCQTLVTETIVEPSAPLSLSINDFNDVNCFGDQTGSAIAIAAGGTPNYSYSWTTAPVQNSDSATNLGAGTYTCNVYDAQGCFASASVTISQPTQAIALSIDTIVNVACYGDNTGSASINAIGGTPGYTYAWNTAPVQTTATASGLAAGTYTCTVTDSLGCSETISVTIEQPQQALGINLITQQDVNCFGDASGSLQVNAFGGTPNYTCIWDNDSTQMAPSYTNLPVGTYQVLVTDANGCIDSTSYTITQPAAPLALNLVQVDPILCNGDANGSITVDAVGGTPIYAYTWLNSSSLVGANISGLDAQNYIGIVTDVNGCTDTLEVPLDDPELLEATITADTALCFGAAIDVVVAPVGGTGNYNYSWTPNLSTGSLLNDVPQADQVYTCTVTDANNCNVTVATTVIVHYTDPDDITAISDQLTICEFDSVMLSYSFASSTIGLDIEWEHCPTCDPDQPVFAQIVSDTMFVISATNQCSQTVYDTVYVNYHELPVVDIALNSDTICEFNTVSFINYGDNNPSWDYAWDFGDGNTSTDPSPENFYDYNGSYNVSLLVTNEFGCTSLDTASATIVVNPQAIASFIIDPGSVTTMDDPVFNFTNTAIHANEFIWIFGDGDYSFQEHPTHMYEYYGEYNVLQIANNEFNCPDTLAKPITIKPSHGVYVPNAFTPDGDKYNNTFFPETYGLAKDGYHMQIFNRWGEVIFESFEEQIGWDGKYQETPVKEGVYTWVIYYKTLDNQVHKIVGHVSVLR
ncbi:gliding motility-associated C-terminal domain-containing protein [Lishizhenia tianjinensis]|uniref:Gliding motility-associated C-terminal domain-containing protein n=1 Tax=Lishizhenia tianjinensis TaxID=477690 RepID=A0A1I6YUJ6_9FLAO|nr:PKD domain-containing protein [Lishizhenia tianjinensis]SFT54150.1 gliding motility-associated C-terminal domain-containing protein [Lishizhenia tianjinensis]